ncbi:hypothetical protein E4U60_001323 [Claviceps pazoutovae]|uniref:Defects in morphology protein 1 n=1 Tax=Claviceps pazoutovae TaxID=1649127 RepID=A0A9P7MD61_9HYPO|nr:hypothetical protein E4U60_001323 [Claviceps pazoutovae]
MDAHETSDYESNYGSDFSPEDEQLLIQLVTRTNQACPSTAVTDILTAPSCETVCSDGIFRQTDTFNHGGSSSSARPYIRDRFQAPQAVCDLPPPFPKSVAFDTDVTYPDLSHALATLARSRNKGAVVETPTGESTGSEDDRSPLQRFRSIPKRPLAVSDLTAGAWCELQYWYTLTELPDGRRTKTAAMKGGTKIHKKLEDEVHTTVRIDVLTNEDGFALKLWNFIHGLRTLRENGLTRELEVWGVVQGNFVNGVVDVVSHDNPNPDFERELLGQIKHDPNQKSLMDFFGVDRNLTPKAPSPSPLVYVGEVKTRGSLGRVPKSVLRPAKIQVMLYHRFLSQIAAGELDFLALLRRYRLDADSPLSDRFLAQIEDLRNEVFHDSPIDETSGKNGVGESSCLEASVAENVTSFSQLKYHTLRELISLVKEEVEKTFPEGDGSMGQMLRVQYVHRNDGSEIDKHDFPVSSQVLDGYLKGYMSWWQGERKAVGVDIEEAFKCGYCQFAQNCSWRNSMADERMQKALEVVSARRKKDMDEDS